MSDHLSRRQDCVFNGCSGCGSFVLILDQAAYYRALEPTQLCDGCGHPWLSHSAGRPAADDGNAAMAKGGCNTTSCGGFYSTDSPWTARTVCVCGASWVMHQALSTPTGVRTSMVPPAGPYYPMPQPNFNPPAPTFSTAPPISTVPPVTAFAGLAPPVAGSANTRRMTAAQRHSTRGHGGPSNTSTTRVNAPTLPAATPPAALVPVVAPPETPVATATPSFTKFTVGLYPFALPGQSTRNTQDFLPSGPELKWSGDDLAWVQNSLASTGLVFQVSLEGLPTGAEPVWQSFHAQVTAHCLQYGITMKTGNLRSERRPPHAPSTLPWQLLKPGSSRVNRSNQRMTKYEAHGNLTPSNFTLATLSTAPFGGTIVNHLHGDLQFLLIAPRFGNIQAPLRNLRLDGQPPSPPAVYSLHRCFPARVLAARFDNLSAQCISSCIEVRTPVDSSVEARQSVLTGDLDSDSSSDESDMNIVDLLRHNPSPSSVATTTGSSIVRAPVTPSRSVVEAIRSTMAPRRPRSESVDEGSAAPSARRRRIEPVSLIQGPSETTSGALPFKYLPYEPVAERAIAAWQEAVAAACSTPDSRPTAFFSGPTAELVASALVFLLIWQFNPAPPPDAQFAAAIAATAPGVTCRLVPLSALLNTDQLMIVAKATGNAPTRAVLRAAINKVTSDSSFWIDAGKYKSLSLHCSRDGGLVDRETILKAAGFLCFMHIAILGVGPMPVSPFVLQAVMEGCDNFYLDRQFIEAMDLDAFKVLKCWYDWASTGEPLKLLKDDPLSLLLSELAINTFAVQGRSLPDVERFGVERTLTCRVLLGSDTDMISHPDFTAFKTGFDFMCNAHSVRGLAEAFSGRIKGLVGTLCSRKITCAQMVVDNHLHFKSSATDQADREFEALFRTHLEQYLVGAGHPSGLSTNVVTEERFLADAQNTTLRCSLLLSMMSGSSLTPPEYNWKLKFVFRHFADVPMAVVEADAVESTVTEHTVREHEENTTREDEEPAVREDEAPAVREDEAPAVREDEAPAVRADNGEKEEPLMFQACFRKLIVPMDSVLRRILQAEREEGKASAFEAWFHAIVLHGQGFNRA